MHRTILTGVFPLQIFFDDSVRNIDAGKRIGLKTVLVSPHKLAPKLHFNQIIYVLTVFLINLKINDFGLCL